MSEEKVDSGRTSEMQALWALITLKPLAGIYRTVIAIVTCGLLVLALFMLYQFMWQVMAGEVYKSRLQTLSQDYEKLRSEFNDVVAESAVTELLVEDGEIHVIFRTKLGVLEKIATGIKADDEEVHVDYTVVNGRLWIRRLFKLNGEKPFMIKPEMAKVPWDEEGKVYGLTIYRPLSEGRWVIRTTPQGALSIALVEKEDEVKLVAPPPVRSYEVIEEGLSEDLTQIKANAVFDRIMGIDRKGQSESGPSSEQDLKKDRNVKQDVIEGSKK